MPENLLDYLQSLANTQAEERRQEPKSLVTAFTKISFDQNFYLLTPPAIEPVPNNLICPLAMGTFFFLGKLIIFPSLSITLDRNLKVKYHINNYLNEALENTLSWG